jgi:signal transduction histidine kinase
MMLMENQRLEHMVKDAGVYSDLFQGEPLLTEVSLEGVLCQALEELDAMPEKKTARIEMNLDPKASCVQGDPHALRIMFYYLLQNSLEAMDPRNPLICVSSEMTGLESTELRIEIFNTGKSPGPEELANLFVPFYSTKPYGTGFGLPIAQVVARKCLGDVVLEPVPGAGTRCIVRLPAGHSPRTNSRPPGPWRSWS